MNKKKDKNITLNYINMTNLINNITNKYCCKRFQSVEMIELIIQFLKNTSTVIFKSNLGDRIKMI